MNKKLAKTLVSIGVIGSFLSTNILSVWAGTTDGYVQRLKEAADYDEFTIEVVDEVPENVIPKEFDTIEEAEAWIQDLASEYKVKGLVQTLGNEGILNDGFEFRGDTGSCMYDALPGGTSTFTGTNSYDVEGLSAQTITGTFYFEYSNYQVTNSNSSYKISGAGAASFNPTYQALEKYGVYPLYNFYNIMLGDLGYFINVGGVDVGVYHQLELDYCLYTFNGVDVR